MDTAKPIPADQAGEWERKARHLLASVKAPHFSPDPDVLAIVERRLQSCASCQYIGGTALVLGATPELADLAVANGLRLMAVDRSAAMLEASMARRALTNPERESYHVADWRDMSMLADGSIDVILGDAALNNVPDEAMDDVLDELARVARQGGMMLLRQIVLPDAPVPDYEFKNAVDRLRAGKIDFNALDRVLRFYGFNSVAFDPVRHALDARRVFAGIRDKHDAGELRREEFEFLMGRYSEVCHTVYSVSEQARRLGRLGRCEVERLPATVFFRELMAVFVVEVA